jgi:hypothetical protein
VAAVVVFVVGCYLSAVGEVAVVLSMAAEKLTILFRLSHWC